MAFGDLVQSGQASATGASPQNLSPTLPVGATAGNLIIAAFSRSTAVTWGSDDAAYSLIGGVASGVGNMSTRWLYKIATGGETSITNTATGLAGNGRGVIAEFEGPFAASPLDQSAEDETHISSAATSQSSGTTGTTAQADELAIAFFGADAANNVDGGRAYTNGFTEAVFGSTTSNTGFAMASIATKVLSSTGTVETTYSTTDGGDEMYGAVATFKKQVAGGSIVPVLMNHYRRRRS